MRVDACPLPFTCAGATPRDLMRHGEGSEGYDTIHDTEIRMGYQRNSAHIDRPPPPGSLFLQPMGLRRNRLWVTSQNWEVPGCPIPGHCSGFEASKAQKAVITHPPEHIAQARMARTGGFECNGLFSSIRFTVWQRSVRRVELNSLLHTLPPRPSGRRSLVQSTVGNDPSSGGRIWVSLISHLLAFVKLTVLCWTATWWHRADITTPRPS